MMAKGSFCVTVFIATCGIFASVAGETLYNGIVLPDKWPPRIDAMFPGPTTPPYLKCPPAVIPIDIGRQLFVDDFLVASSEGLVRKFYKPVKFEGNPVLWPETDEELARWTKLGDRPYPAAATTAQMWNPMYKSVPACCLSGGGVWWDPKRSKFRMWYLASWSGLLAIAESDDAVHWTRPKVGPRGTNVLIYPDHYFDTFSVWPDFTTNAPYDNWRMFVSPGENPCRAYEYASADGIKWEMKTRTGLGGDSSTVFFNPFRRKWVWSIRAAWRLRSRMYREHDDFFVGAAWDFGSFTSEQKTGADPLFYRANRWSNTKDCYLWLACDYDDVPREIGGTRRRCELYNVDATPYESIMVGLFKIISGRDNDEAAQHGMPKTTTIHFAYSRDGFHFARPDRMPAIPDSDWESGCWDSGYLSPCSSGFVIKDERLLFFYNAARGDATMKSEKCRLANGLHANISIGFASLRRDGFAGMVADGAGSLVTRPVTFTGSHLFVNADARFGTLTAEIIDSDGKPFPGYAAADCEGLVRVDATKRAVSWKGGDLSRFAGKPVRFRFNMKVATLYAFWVSKDATGKSGGYLAAGGPCYAGPKDD